MARAHQTAHCYSLMDSNSGQNTTTPAKFNAIERTNTPASIGLPDELWVTILESPCMFNASIFSGVMLNLIKNPNVTSSHLFRADILYDSGKDYQHGQSSSLKNHLQEAYRPIQYDLKGFDLTRTIVRKLIPRNPQLDAPLVQTCHSYDESKRQGERNVVVYIPHVQQAGHMPFYHPAVRMVAFEHRVNGTESEPQREDGEFVISISYRLFPGTDLDNKLERTALKLLQTIHKHGQGQLAGYEKRVHHDQIVPQKRYQDTYTRLKAKYGKSLAEQWVEVTDPGKHVFEDIGIAAFLIELWQDMYTVNTSTGIGLNDSSEHDVENGIETEKPVFPGFVDIGCGNGILVYLLLSEGYEGWGFDARERKTWSIFPDRIRQRLERRLLIPEVFVRQDELRRDVPYHAGKFKPGTFIISNHADELTAWTPLLAYLNMSAFIAIPCCSHDFAGARFRAPASAKTQGTSMARLPQQERSNNPVPADHHHSTSKSSHAAETGSLKRTEVQKKMPSAYSSLCTYVSSLAEEVGFEPETEVLRIPSTRNHSIIGRRWKHSDGEDLAIRRSRIVTILERELGKTANVAAEEWIARADKLASKPGSGH
jgi:tRNASer (uridine44-2'-O)-methyltransferase